jgi:two-component system, NarL family, nitrate/nitrite response regulator NarL
VNVRIVLADDHPIVLQGLEHLFGRQDGFEVVAACHDAASALDAVTRLRPDIVVLDLRMPGLTGRENGGIDLLEALARECPDCKRIVLTAAITDEEVVDVLQHGASGLILKESPPDQLVECVRRVYAGEQWLDQNSVTRALRDVLSRNTMRGEASKTLTAREVEIVKMVGQGLRNRAIGDRLKISEATVKVHLYNIYQKLEVEGRVELVLLAQQKGLI